MKIEYLYEGDLISPDGPIDVSLEVVPVVRVEALQAWIEQSRMVYSEGRILDKLLHTLTEGR